MKLQLKTLIISNLPNNIQDQDMKNITIQLTSVIMQLRNFLIILTCIIAVLIVAKDVFRYVSGDSREKIEAFSNIKNTIMFLAGSVILLMILTLVINNVVVPNLN